MKELIKELIEKYEDKVSQAEKLGRINPYSGYYAGQEDAYDEMLDDLEEVLKIMASER